jgi:NitT/TauT family transport system substrate-binding protein
VGYPLETTGQDEITGLNAMGVVMRIANRKLKGFCLASVCMLLFPACAFATDLVKVSVYQSVSDAGIYIAADKGYFAEQDIAIETVQLDSVSSVVTALASGQVDVAGGAPSAAIYNAVRQGIGIKIVADKGSMQAGAGYIGMVVRNAVADRIKSPADLRGHSIALAGFGVGTTNEVAMNEMLKRLGLKESDFTLQNLSFGDSFAALASGSVDAAYLIEPLIQSAEQKGVGKLLTTGDEMYPNQQVAVLLYGPDFAAKHKDTAQRFMVAYLKGVRDYNNAFRKDIDRAAIAAILSKNTTVKTPALYDKMIMPGLDPNGSINATGMAEDMQWFLSKGYLKEAVDVSRAIDTSFAQDAVQKLGKY